MFQRKPTEIGGKTDSELGLIGKCTTAKVRLLTEIKPLMESLTSQMDQNGFPYMDRFSARFAIREAITNAISHAHCGDPSKTVHVSFLVMPEYVLAEVIDEGPGFDPAGVASPMLRDTYGRTPGSGLFLMRLFMTWIRFDGQGKRVTMCKMRSADRPIITRTEEEWLTRTDR